MKFDGELGSWIDESMSRFWRETHCWLTRGIVFGLISGGEVGVDEGS